jgi:hypothetical protein
MKVLDYSKVNGTQDRDDTMLVAKIVPYHSDASQPTEGPSDDRIANQPKGAYFETKEIVLAQVSKSSDALCAEEGRQVTENLSV